MIQTQQVGISLIMIGVATVLMVVTAPTLENQQALAVSQPMIKKVSLKDPPTKVKKDPPRKVRKVLRCGWFRGKRVCRWVPLHFRGPVVKPPVVRPPVVRPPVVRPPVVRPSSTY
jgi:hypothetical protein